MHHAFPPIEPYATGMLDVGDGHQLYWERCGNPAGRPVLCVHGGPGSGCTPGQRRWFDPRGGCRGGGPLPTFESWPMPVTAGVSR